MEINDIIKFLLEVDPYKIYLALFFIAFIENIFPPSPSDVIIVFGGSLVAIGKTNFFLALISASLGSLIGFIAVYVIGKWFGKKIIESGKIKFIPLENIHKTETWFIKYGYWIIIGNRFLAGTRGIVAFFAGVSEIDFRLTSLLSFVSALFWNFLLLFGGYVMGKNWETIIGHLKTYWLIVTILLILFSGIWTIKYFISKRKHEHK